MLKAYRYKLEPNKSQRYALARTLDVCRELYNEKTPGNFDLPVTSTWADFRKSFPSVRMNQRRKPPGSTLRGVS